MLIAGPLPPWTQRVDGGILLLVAALFLASVLAHRYWRRVIRLEDELEARDADHARRADRYREAFRRSPFPAAFADRATGLVVEASPGWTDLGLPGPGEPLAARDPALEEAWRAIPGPAQDGTPALPVILEAGGTRLEAACLGGPSLGLVLLAPEGRAIPR